MTQAILAYIPVLHNGYLQLFSKHPEAKTLYLLDESVTHQWRSLQKDLRALPAKQMKTIIESLHLFDEVHIITDKNIEHIGKAKVKLIMPDEEINHELADKYFSNLDITFDSIFLRWDKNRSLSREEVEPDVTISTDEFDQQVMNEITELASHSSDWWRQVSGALVKDDKVILTAKNYHLPFDQQHYVDGDPRADFSSGDNYGHVGSAQHSEASLITQAAQQGISTEGCSLYVTTFPCAVCSKLVAESGIKKVYYFEGYTMLDGEAVMKAKGIEIVKVKR